MHCAYKIFQFYQICECIASSKVFMKTKAHKQRQTRSGAQTETERGYIKWKKMLHKRNVVYKINFMLCCAKKLWLVISFLSLSCVQAFRILFTLTECLWCSLWDPLCIKKFAIRKLVLMYFSFCIRGCLVVFHVISLSFVAYIQRVRAKILLGT